VLALTITYLPRGAPRLQDWRDRERITASWIGQNLHPGRKRRLGASAIAR
jgi:hypothetical protein